MAIKTIAGGAIVAFRIHLISFVAIAFVLAAQSTHAQSRATYGSVILQVDAPLLGATLRGPFSVRGWALDQNAPTGTGIDAIHLWAFPDDGSASVLLGAAALGIARPDVAQAYGAAFHASGFNITSALTLKAGSYTLRVFGRQSSTQSFVVVASVPVNVSGVTLSDLIPCRSGQGPRFDGSAWACADTIGAQGPKGDRGDKGDKGDRGDSGPQGPAGSSTGIPGPIGPAGPAGAAGSAGAAGPAGAKGEKGDRGEKGERGDAGPTGPQGPAGASGGAASSAYAYVYNVANQTLGIEDAIAFSSNGIVSEGISHAAGSSEIVITTPGIYEVQYSVMTMGGIDLLAQPSMTIFSLYVNGGERAEMQYGHSPQHVIQFKGLNGFSASTPALNVLRGHGLVNVSAGDRITIRLKAGSINNQQGAVLPGAIGANTVNASVLLKKVN